MKATRKEYIAGLRSLADYLEDHADVPTEGYPGSILVHAFGHDDETEHALVDAAAAAMDVVADGDTYYTARRMFGPFSFEVMAISHAHMAEYNEINKLGREALEARKAAAAVPESDRLPTGCRVTVVTAPDEDESLIGSEGIVAEHTSAGEL